MANGLLGSSPENFQGLLGDPLFNVGIGLLASGLSRPQNVGQGLLQGLQAGSGLQSQVARNELMRESLLAKKAQREQLAQRQAANQRLIDLFTGDGKQEASAASGAPIGLLGGFPGAQAAQGPALPAAGAQGPTFDNGVVKLPDIGGPQARTSPQGGIESQLSLTPQEQRIVDYHRNSIRTGRVGAGPNGEPVTVFSTGIRIPEGPNKGKFVSVPGFVNGRILSEREAYDHWKDEIQAGQWPMYDSGEALNQRSQEIHGVMDAEGGAARAARQPAAPAGPSQRQILGLLAEAAPEQFAQGLLGQVFAKPREMPADIRMLEAAGIDPRSPEGQELIKRSIAGQDITGQLAQLQVMQTQLEIQRQAQAIQDARRKAAEAEREGKAETGTLRREIFEQLQLGREAAGLLTELEGTFGQTGFGADFRGGLVGALALAQDMFGEDSEEAQRIASKLERLKQISTRFGLENFEAFSGSISDTEVQIALGKDLAPGKTPGANRQALADRLSIALNQADVQGFEVRDREDIEALIAELRGGGQARTPAPQNTPTAPPAAAPGNSGSNTGTRRFRFDPESGGLVPVK